MTPIRRLHRLVLFQVSVAVARLAARVLAGAAALAARTERRTPDAA